MALNSDVKIPAEGPVMVRNTEPNPTVLTWGPASRDYIAWEAAGDPNGNDIVEVTQEVVQTTQFRRMLRRNIFAIVEDQKEIDAAEELQQQSWEDTRRGAHEADESILEKPKEKSFEVLTCIGPSDNKNSAEKCGAVLTMKDADLKENPPLCARHKGLRASFVPTDSVDEEGNPKTEWTSVSIRR